MELIYLWVENYKNIKQQGFNFSPKFTCKYDEVTNELTIDEKDYYVSIFPENINVTAIVGENGSGKSSLLDILDNKEEFININHFTIYKKEGLHYCEYNHVNPEIVFDQEVKKITRNIIPLENSFTPKIIRVAYNENIGEKRLDDIVFGQYSININSHEDRKKSYNMLEARFFVPKYINIITDYIELFNQLNEMYQFDTLRLLLKNNSTSHIKQWIDKQKKIVRYDSKKVCMYEKNEHYLEDIQKEQRYPIEIQLHNKNREKIVSILENIESMHRQQGIAGQIKNKNKYQEFDLAVLIAFIEYYLKNTDSCDPSDLVYETLLELKDQIKDQIENEDIIIIIKSYILDFFQKLKDKEIKFTNDDPLSMGEIIEAIKYIQQFNVNNFNEDGNPFFDIPIDTALKENLHHIKILQKIFFDYEFDSGEENFLRVFEYDLINNKIGSSYETISDGEKHFIRFAIDIIYNLQILKTSNFTSTEERLALFLADEPDNAMHPIWKQKLINHVIEIFKNYSETQNIKQHFIFTTHSPFLLSDIPKENVIFLEKDKKTGKCINASKKVDINPFGANIHTLLSHGFFMQDGLIGEFAKGKINEVIKYIKNEDSPIKNDKEAQNIINIIGEPILQSTLQNKLDTKLYPDESKLDKLIRQQEKIEEAIEQEEQKGKSNEES